MSCCKLLPEYFETQVNSWASISANTIFTAHVKSWSIKLGCICRPLFRGETIHKQGYFQACNPTSWNHPHPGLSGQWPFKKFSFCFYQTVRTFFEEIFLEYSMLQIADSVSRILALSSHSVRPSVVRCPLSVDKHDILLILHYMMF